MLSNQFNLNSLNIKTSLFDGLKQHQQNVTQLLNILSKVIDGNTAFINQQDNDGKTPLHWIASLKIFDQFTMINVRLMPSVRQDLKKLFDLDVLDLTIKDNDGNTALHLAANNCCNDNFRDFIFPIFIQSAIRKKFDFSILGKDGLALLHLPIVALNQGLTVNSDHSKKILNFLLTVPNIDINVLSLQGHSALYYAIDNLDIVFSLLKAGANPLASAKSGLHPYSVIKACIEAITACIDSTPIGQPEDGWPLILADLVQAEEMMAKIIDDCSMRKNARLISQLSREHPGFSRLPNELLIAILARTSNSIYKEQKASQFAIAYFDRPKITNDFIGQPPVTLKPKP